MERRISKTELFVSVAVDQLRIISFAFLIALNENNSIGIGFPPVVVLRIVPASPTTVPMLLLIYEISFRKFSVPLNCKIQLMPLSVVLRIIPSKPTIVPVFSSLKYTFVKEPELVGVWIIQFNPPLVFLNIALVKPTAVPIKELIKCTPQRCLVVPLA